MLALNSTNITSEQTGNVTVKKVTGSPTLDSPFTEWPEIKVQVIGGGAGSRNANANGKAYGAGGAGGHSERRQFLWSRVSRIAVTVGAGGGVNANGGSSFFKCTTDIWGTEIQVDGGGKSGSGAPTVEFGGSGGGGSGQLNSGGNGGAGGNYGNRGGKGGGSSTTGAGGAGGGATQEPAEALNGSAKQGGRGAICFDNIERAGGGGGSSASVGQSGSAGGGRGATPGQTAGAGTPNYGGGAGATCPSGTSNANGNTGGSGVRSHQIFNASHTISAGAKIDNPNGDGYLYRFYSSGSITF